MHTWKNNLAVPCSSKQLLMYPETIFPKSNIAENRNHINYNYNEKIPTQPFHVGEKST